MDSKTLNLNDSYEMEKLKEKDEKPVASSLIEVKGKPNSVPKNLTPDLWNMDDTKVIFGNK